MGDDLLWHSVHLHKAGESLRGWETLRVFVLQWVRCEWKGFGGHRSNRDTIIEIHCVGLRGHWVVHATYHRRAVNLYAQQYFTAGSAGEAVNYPPLVHRKITQGDGQRTQEPTQAEQRALL